jgi:hypothetical protein
VRPTFVCPSKLDQVCRPDFGMVVIMAHAIFMSIEKHMNYTWSNTCRVSKLTYHLGAAQACASLLEVIVFRRGRDLPRIFNELFGVAIGVSISFVSMQSTSTTSAFSARPRPKKMLCVSTCAN